MRRSGQAFAAALGLLASGAGAQPTPVAPPSPAGATEPDRIVTSAPTISAAETARRAGKLSPRPSKAELKALWEGGGWSGDIAHGGAMMSKWKPGDYVKPDAVAENMIPLKPGPMARYKEIRREMGRGRQTFGPYTQCHHAGMPYVLTIDFSGGYEAVVADDQLIFFYGAENEFRRIYLDGRPHPDERTTPALYDGFSVAHWEGRTMVVETTNIRGSNTQIEPHVPKAEGSYIVERYTPLAPGRMALQMTMMNPDFTRPWVVDFVMSRDPKARPIEMLCTDDNHWVFRNGELVLTGANGEVLEKADE